MRLYDKGRYSSILMYFLNLSAKDIALEHVFGVLPVHGIYEDTQIWMHENSYDKVIVDIYWVSTPVILTNTTFA